ncbi:FIST signal transduction protein [Bacillus sp. JJ722]|uniref:FIST signal transduction protein n=1 Tax=Bacillus sp. JJ722 TaxID=3122973 RepID=UPI002FFE9BC9
MSMIKTVNSQHNQLDLVFKEVTQSLHSNPVLILFFASTKYSFEELSTHFHQTYPNSEIVGLTTTGEIGPKGLSNGGLSAMSFSKNIGVAKAVLMENIEKYPIFYRKKLKEAATKVGINTGSNYVSKEGIGLVFPNGLIAAEEKMLSVVNSIFDNEGFPLFGGTAGDDAKFQQTMISLNGRVSSIGGIVIFIKPDVDTFIMKENIFQSTKKEMKITKSNTEGRIVYEFDGRPAASVYASRLGISESNLPNYFMTNPLGRKVNNEIFIASPFQVLPDGGIQFYCQLFQDTKVDILEPKEPVEALKQTLHNLHKEFATLDGVLAVNCILRKQQFQNQNLYPALNNELSKIPNLAGFSSYGEQLNKSQINQTLILLGFGTRK